MIKKSSFVQNSCKRTTALASLSSFVANGGALFVSLTVFQTASEFALARPEVTNTIFTSNRVEETHLQTQAHEVSSPRIEYTTVTPFWTRTTPVGATAATAMA